MYFTWKKVSLFMLIICLVTAGSFAAPHWGDVFEFEQPDMSLVKAKVWGDEFYHRVESLDGYTLVRDPVSNFICYANLKPNAEEYVSTGVVYTGLSVEDIHAFTGKSRGIMTSLSKRLKLKRSVILEKSNRARKDLNSWESNRISALGSEESSVESQMAVAAEAAPLSGSVVGITLLIEFPDVPGTISQSEVNNYCNQVGYSNYSNNGSIRDYFYDISNGLLTYTNEVTVYYTAKNNRSYYTDPDVRYGVRAKELIKEALVWLDDTNGQNFDFDLLSVNSSNRFLAINVFYAGGRVNAWAEGLWPHAAGMNDLFVSNDGPKSGDYQITNIGSSLSLGAFCHENGHMICKWPDLYDSGYESSGTGAYCLMSRGDSHNPLPPNPYLKDLKGWQTVIDITDDPASRISQANSFSCFRYSHPTNSREFFMIENREKSGRSTEIPDSGLLIWHIDEDGSNNNEQMTPALHYQVSVEQADGLFHLENGRTGGGSNDLFHAGNKDVFNDDTLPDAKWWDGEESGLSIHSISGLSSSMSFITSKEIAIGVTAAGDNPPNETADKAFDGDYSTKWLDFSPTGSWIQNRYAYDARYYITEYAITSANDHPERDPKYWNLLGSNDGGESWDMLDSRTGVIFDNRFETQKFSVTSPGTYNIYRLKITAVQDVSIANSVQIAEIQLFSRPTLTIRSLGSEQIRISWPLSATDWRLQNKLDLKDGAPWLFDTNDVIELDGRNTITKPAIGPRYFRLIK